MIFWNSQVNPSTKFICVRVLNFQISKSYSNVDSAVHYFSKQLAVLFVIKLLNQVIIWRICFLFWIKMLTPCSLRHRHPLPLFTVFISIWTQNSFPCSCLIKQPTPAYALYLFALSFCPSSLLSLLSQFVFMPEFVYWVFGKLGCISLCWVC